MVTASNVADVILFACASNPFQILGTQKSLRKRFTGDGWEASKACRRSISYGDLWEPPGDRRGRSWEISAGDLREISGRSPGDLREMRLSLFLWKIFILERLRDISGRFPGDLREISGRSPGDLWEISGTLGDLLLDVARNRAQHGPPVFRLTAGSILFGPDSRVLI